MVKRKNTKLEATFHEFPGHSWWGVKRSELKKFKIPAGDWPYCRKTKTYFIEWTAAWMELKFYLPDGVEVQEVGSKYYDDFSQPNWIERLPLDCDVSIYSSIQGGAL